MRAKHRHRSMRSSRLACSPNMQTRFRPAETLSILHVARGSAACGWPSAAWTSLGWTSRRWPSTGREIWLGAVGWRSAADLRSLILTRAYRPVHPSMSSCAIYSGTAALTARSSSAWLRAGCWRSPYSVRSTLHRGLFARRRANYPRHLPKCGLLSPAKGGVTPGCSREHDEQIKRHHFAIDFRSACR
jgi:hypothetical protein